MKAGVEVAGNCMQAVQRLEAAGKGRCQQEAMELAVVVWWQWREGLGWRQLVAGSWSRSWRQLAEADTNKKRVEQWR